MRSGALFAPVDAASLAVFRILLGLLAAGETYRLVSGGFVELLWTAPGVRLPAESLAWLPAWSGAGMTLHFYALSALGLAVAAGVFFRASAFLLALGLAYALALCGTAFLTELALLAVLLLLLALTPAHGQLSVDAWLRPGIRSESAPRWAYVLLCAQLTVVQLCAGLELLNGDWLRGFPLQLWLPERSGMPLLGWVYRSTGFTLLASWALLAVLLFAVPALWLPRARAFAFAAVGAVLLWIEEVFDLGVLPWTLLAGNLLFFAPDWPRRIFRWPRTTTGTAPAPGMSPLRWVSAAGAGVWLAAQLVQPFLGFLGPGPAAWSGGGAVWRLLAASKGGAVKLGVLDPGSERERKLDPADDLTPWQYRRVATQPPLLLRYARYVADRETGPAGRPRVRARGLVTLNGRIPQRLVDPAADLATVAVAPILPLEIPLARQWPTQNEWPPPREELTRK